MNTLSRLLVLAAVLLVGLVLLEGTAWAQPVVVSYYGPPVVTYAPAAPYYMTPTTVTTTRYGVFGLRRSTTVNYGSYYPAPVVSSYYYAPPVVRTYYAPPVVRSYYAPPVIITYP